MKYKQKKIRWLNTVSWEGNERSQLKKWQKKKVLKTLKENACIITLKYIQRKGAKKNIKKYCDFWCGDEFINSANRIDQNGELPLLRQCQWCEDIV